MVISSHMAPKRTRTSDGSSFQAQHDTQHGARQPATCYLQFTNIAHRSRHEGTSYDATRSRLSAIINPYFRYLHRALAHTLFGQGDSEGAVRRSELLVLWAMVNDFPIDTGSFLVRQFSKIVNFESSAIVLGGFVTPIALRFEKTGSCKNHPKMPSTTTVQLYHHPPTLTRSGRLMDLSPMPLSLTHYSGSSISSNISSTVK
ncbi:hypothetical protein Salat_1659000 [Sesamum alatum]|uniref:Uncharacterized protein n=1 Tax=Sesamum alatum TaxID=300844 RepID=A0AAE2CJW9_9LAMI|nr:hypothetical protein Salat_1659000 [Sesamum alatum]